MLSFQVIFFYYGGLVLSWLQQTGNLGGFSTKEFFPAGNGGGRGKEGLEWSRKGDGE